MLLPAASVALAVKLWLPSPSGVAGVKLQLPAPSAVVMPIGVPLSNTLTVLLASAVPVRAGVVSLVLPPLTMTPVVGAKSSVALAMTGAIAGAVVSTVKPKAPLGALVLPAASVAVAVKLWLPSPSGVVGVKLQLPAPSAVAVPIGVPLSSTLTV